MKKIALFLLSSLVLFSCRREVIPGPPGPPGPSGPGTYFIKFNLTVQPNDWQPFGQPGDPDFQYYAGFNAPEIDQFAFDNALIIGYLIDNGVAYLLPNTINYGDWITEYSMIYAVNVVEFIAKDSDLQTEPPNNPITFRVFIIEPEGQVDGMKDWDLKTLENYLETHE